MSTSKSSSSLVRALRTLDFKPLFQQSPCFSILFLVLFTASFEPGKQYSINIENGRRARSSDVTGEKGKLPWWWSVKMSKIETSPNYSPFRTSVGVLITNQQKKQQHRELVGCASSDGRAMRPICAPLKNGGSPWLRPRLFCQTILRVLFRWILSIFQQNLEFTALPVSDIIRVPLKF